MTRLRLPFIVLATATLLAACGASSAEDGSDGLATLEDPSVVATTTPVGVTDEDAVFAFADCMRENGLPDFQDPIVNPDDSIEFLGGARDDSGEGGNVAAALGACEDLLGDITFTGGRGGDFDPIELEDELLLLAQCLRDNGLEAADPDISEGFGGNRDQAGGEEGTQRGPGALFGDGIDLSDPATQEIFERCAEEVNFEPPGGGGRGGAG